MPTPLTKGKIKTVDNLWFFMPSYVQPPQDPDHPTPPPPAPTPLWIEDESQATVTTYSSYLVQKKAIPTLIFVPV